MSRVSMPLFVNPTAGRGRAGKRLPRIVELLQEAGIEPDVVQSSGVGDLETQVRVAVDNGASRIIVAGGDGSVHEAVNAILAGRSDAAFGVIPSGTGNDFAKAADIPLDWETATRLLADRVVSDAVPRTLDAGRVNDRYFANGAGIGFDAKVTRIARAYRWPIGDLVYLFAIFRAMQGGIATPDLSIEADTFRLSGPVTLASISNGPWIGGMFHIAPQARNDDGTLELLVVDPVTRLRITSLLPKLMQGKHMDEPEIRHASITRALIRCSEDLPSHLDGEVQPLCREFELEVLPEALHLL